jgi:thiamine-monophosphate kinase
MKKISSIGEIKLIERMKRILGKPKGSVIVGIGDDAAVLKHQSAKKYLLFASDMFVEGVHFSLRNLTPEFIGNKALAANISDIAAMGGKPCFALVSVGLSPSTPIKIVDGIYRGISRLARRFDVSIVGGDAVRSKQLVIDVSILGEVEKKYVVSRSGALPGDLLFVTGRLGGSLKSKHHAKFTPRLKEARHLVENSPIHSMIDLSDGLASDAWQIARASQVAIGIIEERIPLSTFAKSVHNALIDGEDFELLFSVSSSAAKRMPKSIAGTPVTQIGFVKKGVPDVRLISKDGKSKPIILGGFKHF